MDNTIFQLRLRVRPKSEREDQLRKAAETSIFTEAEIFSEMQDEIETIIEPHMETLAGHLIKAGFDLEYEE